MSEGIKALVGNKQSKDFAFLGGKVKVTKFSLSEVKQIQAKAKEIEAAEKERKASGEESTDDSFELPRMVIRMAVEGGDQLTDEDFDAFPLDDMNKLAAEIMKYSGLSDQGK